MEATFRNASYPVNREGRRITTRRTMGWTVDPRRVAPGPPPLPLSLINPLQRADMERRALERHGESVAELYRAAGYWRQRVLALRAEPWWQHAGRRRRREHRRRLAEAERYSLAASERVRDLLGNGVRPPRDPTYDEAY